MFLTDNSLINLLIRRVISVLHKRFLKLSDIIPVAAG